ncbi:MAG: hypothetical protein KAG53_06795 [Endozoicomonadaceae bacterium]|nr:hypothetical protein [Endozoicomonadaceae bacterium]
MASVSASITSSVFAYRLTADDVSDIDKSKNDEPLKGIERIVKHCFDSVPRDEQYYYFICILKDFKKIDHHNTDPKLSKRIKKYMIK